MTAIAIPLSQLASLVDGQVEGDEVTITGVNTLDEATTGEIAFVDNLEGTHVAFMELGP